MKLFITGAAGYVGAMLADQFSKRDDVSEIIALDKEAMPEILCGNKKISWITANVSDDTWQDTVAKKRPDAIIHTAWQIRGMYGKEKLQWKWNVEGSDNVFAFAFENPFVKKIVYFSTVSSYGGFATNTISHRFTEDEPFLESEYLYGIEKKAVETRLRARYEKAKKSNVYCPKIFILRPAAITGPRGRFMMKNRFGLQAALSGRLKSSFLYRIISLLVLFVPATKQWCRQFIHEDDVTNIVDTIIFNDHPVSYEAFNICPPGDPVLAHDMARAVGKRVLRIYPWMVRLAFFLFWHGTRGRVPTSRGVWKFYSYPLIVDGSKLSRMLKYQYQHNGTNAFYYTDGRYELFVPETERRSRASR